MRKSIYFLAAALAFAPALQAAPQPAASITDKFVQVLNATPERVALRCDTPDLQAAIEATLSGESQPIALDGEASTLTPGRPQLPVIARFVVVDPTSNLRLEVTHSDPERTRAEQPPALVIAEEGASVEDFDDNGVYPSVVVEMGTPFIIRGVRMVRVAIYPLRFDSNTNEYIHYRSIEAEVVTAPGEPVNPIVHPPVRHHSPDFQQFISDFAVNGRDALRDDPEFDFNPEYAGTYLIVTNEGCLEWLVPYIEFKRKAGYRMEILSLEDGDARDATVVKEAIQEKYDAAREAGEEPFEFLLLVGDYSNYEDQQNNIGFRLVAPEGTSIWNSYHHADYLYACLEGDDDNPDVAFGRWPGGSEAMLGLMVGRQLAVEANPSLENPEIYGRAAVYSQHWGNSPESEWRVGLQTNVRWGEEVLKRRFDDVRVYENFDYDQYGNVGAGPFVRDQINAPVNIMIGRAELYYYSTRNPQERNFANDIRNNDFFPVNLCLSNMGHRGMETMFRTGDSNNLKGFVASTMGLAYASIGVHTVMWLELVNAVIQREMRLGWGWTYCMNASERFFPEDFQWTGRPAMPLHRTESLFWGDPGFLPWTDVPRLVEMEHTAVITPETHLIEVTVIDAANGDPVEGATVSLYLGNPPDDMDEYAEYNAELFQKLSWTDQQGRARFISNLWDEIEPGTPVYLTTTGRNIKPCFVEMEVVIPEESVEIGEYEFTEVEGNGDESLNPGETFELSLTAINNGSDEAINELVASVISLSPYVAVEEENTVAFEVMQPGEAARGERPVRITIAVGCPDSSARPKVSPELEIIFEAGEHAPWRSGIKLDTRAPHLEFRSVVGGIMIPVGEAEIDIEIINKGRVASNEMIAELSSVGRGVEVVEGESLYPEIAPGRTARLTREPFRVIGSAFAVPGLKVRMMLAVRDEEGFADTTYFELQVGEQGDGGPFGPDAYGYACFDQFDDEWNVAPEYDWIEIDPQADDADFEGERLDFTGESEFDIGEAIVVALGFQTNFYGELFDSITVGSNGYIVPGVQPNIVNYQRWPMEEAVGGGAGMIAPFWNDLRFGEGSGIWFYYDDNEGRAIIEWRRMRFANAQGEVSFQVILLDCGIWLTESGDQDIIFQYQEISNPANVRRDESAWGSGVPFASVGISSPDGRSGLGYTWNNIYPIEAPPLENQTALKFCTYTVLRLGGILGTVLDAETGEPLAGVRLFSGHGFVAITDEEGNYRIPEFIAGVPFTFTAHLQGYNDSTLFDLIIEEGEEIEVNFDLLHPEFVLSVLDIEERVPFDRTLDVPFTITNTGNGPLEWNAAKRLIGDANALPWELRRSYNAGQALDDDRIEGVIFAEDRFFLSGANVSADLDDNTIYSLNRDGEVLDSFLQVNSTRWGYKDMDWDGEFIWAAGDREILALTTEGQVARRFADPLSPTEKIACDRENGILYLSGTTTDIVRADFDGNILGERLPRRSLRIYGLAYWPEDPDGYNLYINNSPGAGTAYVHKMDVMTGDTIRVFQFDLVETAQGQSAFITNEFDIYSWVMMSVQSISRDRGGDRVDIHQLDARKEWFELDIWEGELQAEEVQELTLTLDATGLPDTLFQGELVFRHNADDGEAVVSVALEVVGPPLVFFDLVSPENGDTLFSPVQGVAFTWRSVNWGDLEGSYIHYFQAGNVEISYSVEDTSHTVKIDTLGLPLELEGRLTWWVAAVIDQDTLESRARFDLIVLPENLPREKAAPVEFGLRSLHPNPFNSRTTVTFGADRRELTTLVAYDLTGREAARLFDGVPEVGYHALAWDAGVLPTGVYLVRLESGGRVQVAKVALIR